GRDGFTGRGEGKWRGMLYGTGLQGLRLGGNIIYRGTFGTAMFQCVYRPGASHWAMLPSTLEWHTAATLVALAGLLWSPGLFVALGMVGLSVLVAALQAAQANLVPGHRGLASRLVVAGLCYAQPLVRSWTRYKTRFFSPGVVVADTELPAEPGPGLPLNGRRTVEYWSEHGHDRAQLLETVVAYLAGGAWGQVVGPGWSGVGRIVYCHPGTEVRVCTVQEDHGAGRRLIRARFRLRPGTAARLLGLVGLGAAAAVAWFDPVVGAGVAAAVLGLGVGVWWRGARRAG